MNHPPNKSAASRWIVGICGLLLLVFAVISFSAVLTKNATIDEPTQSTSGWLALRRHDFRVETVSSPLWEGWAAVGNLWSDLPLTHDSVIWNNRTWDPKAEVLWSGQTLYQSPGFDGDAFIQRARAMMLLLGLTLGIVIACWSFELAGPVAAIVSLALFCFDPNFLAHAPLVKSDVSFALVLLALAYSLWRAGHSATIRRVLLIGVLSGVAINLKFSGLLAGPLLAILLLIRALLPDPWRVLGRSLQSRISRVIAGALIGVFAVICCFTITWECYGFRYRPAPSPAVSMDMPAIFAKAKLVEATVELGHVPTPAELAQRVPGSFSRFIQWMDTRHLLPQAMLAGLLYQHTCVQRWPAFLNGDVYYNGRWTYFPLAMLYKTPVAELVTFFFAGCVLIATASAARKQLWTISCLVIPFAIFAAAALTTHLNIGLRNVLPLYPFLYIASGCAVAMLWKRRPRLDALARRRIRADAHLRNTVGLAGLHRLFQFPHRW